ncbi:MAG: Dynamin family protein [Myxococcaceae bacterium]|nr:Dynamin family protein [Myxococcaceae bacterium]
MAQSERSYGDYKTVAESLAKSLRDVAALWEEVGDGGASETATRSARLRSMADHLLSDSFNLMVVGEFKRGKSTLINAMLGRSILPAKIAPCTAVITKVTYAERERATLFYTDQKRAPLEIETNDIKKYIAIGRVDGEPDRIRRSEFERMDVLAPIDLCRQGVSIVDSPGLNEDDTRTEVTRSFLDQADAMVLVLSCKQQLSQSEKEFIQEVLGRYAKDATSIFAIWNEYDAVQGSEDDDADLRARSRQYLEPYIGGATRVFYVSALNGLLARKAQDQQKLLESGLPTFERGLEGFLASERGALKLRSPLGAAEHAIKEFGPLLQQREVLLRASLTDLQQRYDSQQPRFKELERQRAGVLRRIGHTRDRLHERISNSYVTFVSGLLPKLREAVKGVEIGWHELVTDRSGVTKRIEVALRGALGTEQKRWAETVLQPMLQGELEALGDDLAEGVAKYVREVESIRAAITMGPSSMVDGDDVSTLERVLAGVGGLVLGGVGGAVMGGAVGFKGMLKGLGLHLVALFGLVALGLNPVALIIASIVSGLAGTAVQSGSMRDDVKEKLATKFHEGLAATASTDGGVIAEEALKQIVVLKGKIDDALTMMLDELRGQVESSLAELQRGQESVDRRVRELDRFRHRAAAVQEGLRAARSYAEH